MTSHIKRPDEDYSLCGYYDFDNDLEDDDSACNCAELAEQLKGLAPMEVSLLLLEQGVSWGTFYGNDDEIDYLHGAVGEGVGLAQAIMEQRNELLVALEEALSELREWDDYSSAEGHPDYGTKGAIQNGDAAIAKARGEA